MQESISGGLYAKSDLDLASTPEHKRAMASVMKKKHRNGDQNEKRGFH